RHPPRRAHRGRRRGPREERRRLACGSRGNRPSMASLTVQPRPTPEERPNEPVEVEVDEALTVHVTTIEDFAGPRQNWELQLREGTDFGRANNVELRLLFAAGEQTSVLSFRLDQLDAADDTDRKSTRLNSSHSQISYAVSCL